MVHSANASLLLPHSLTYGRTCPLLAGVNFDPTISRWYGLFEESRVGQLFERHRLFEEGRIGRLFEQASNALGLTLYQNQSYQEIEGRLLTNLLACDSNPRYQKASLLLPFERGRCGNGGLDETIEKVRKLLSHICYSHPTAGCEEKKLRSKDSFTKSLILGMEDFSRISERFPLYENPENKKEILAIGRNLLELQRKFSNTHYFFTHGMSQTHALLPKLITELDHRLWPKRDSKAFIFVRVVPPNKKSTIQFNDIVQELKGEADGSWNMRKDDHDFRNELFSADADLLNQMRGESALGFYLENRNVFTSIRFIVCDILTRFAEEFGLNYSECERDLGSGIKLFGGGDGNDGYGTILAYKIPKTLIHNPKTNFIYTSMPYGYPLNKTDPLADLERLVSGRAREGMEKVKGDYNFDSVRFFISHLRPENGIKAFWVKKRKNQNEYDREEADQFTKIADSFFNKILQHCYAQSTPDFPGSKNAECKRLLKETTARIEPERNALNEEPKFQKIESQESSPYGLRALLVKAKQYLGFFSEEGHSFEAEITAAEKAVTGQDREIQKEGLDLFNKLVEKGHGLEAATIAAEKAVAFQDCRYISCWEIRDNGFKLFSKLFKKGYGFDTAESLIEKMRSNSADYSQAYVTEFSRLIESKRTAYERTITISARIQRLIKRLFFS